MATNPYENNTTLPWLPQHQPSPSHDTDTQRAAQWGQQQQQFYGGYTGPQDTDADFLAVRQQPFPTDYVGSQLMKKPAAVAPQQKQAKKAASQKSQQAARMPKEKTLALVRSLKRWLLAASLVTFGLFSGVIAYHQLQTAATNQTTSDPTNTSSSSSSSQNDSNFLDQQGSNSLDTNTNKSGENTSGSNSSSQQSTDNNSTNNSNNNTNNSSNNTDTQQQQPQPPVGGSHTS